MTVLNDITKLDNYEDEDIFDVVLKLERSFGLKFEKDAFYNIKTFGDLCDVFENHIKYEHREDCTKQQAFYRVRQAIGATQQISEDQIKLDTQLAEIFPRHNRRQKAKEFKNYLETDINFLTYPSWLALTLFVGFLLSLVTFFFDWKTALTGVVFSISGIKIADKFAKDLELQTVRDLTEKLSKENYIDIRRTKGTFNRNEILNTIIDTFSKDLDVNKANLTRDDKFSWAT